MIASAHCVKILITSQVCKILKKIDFFILYIKNLNRQINKKLLTSIRNQIINKSCRNNDM